MSISLTLDEPEQWQSEGAFDVHTFNIVSSDRQSFHQRKHFTGCHLIPCQLTSVFLADADVGLNLVFEVVTSRYVLTCTMLGVANLIKPLRS